MNSPIEQVAAAVSDEQAGLAPVTPESELARHHTNVKRALDKLLNIADELERCERVLGQSLPECVRGIPLGDAVDLMSDLHFTIHRLTNDGTGGGAVEQVKRRLKYVKEVTMPERFAEQKITTFSTERFRVTKTTRVNASIQAGQKDDAFKWLRETDHEGLIQETVNASSLSALAKELLTSGHELPDELFSVHTQAGTSVTKKK